MEQNKTDSLGKRIAALRKSHGLTQEKLAEQLGVSPQAVSKWETDTSCPDITMLPRLSALFGVSTDALLGVEAPEPQVVILEKEKKQDAQGDIPAAIRNGTKKWHKIARWGCIVFCITAILICAVLLLRSLSVFFTAPGVPVWNYIWPLMLFGVGLWVVFDRPLFGICMMAVGGYEFIHFGWGVGIDLRFYAIMLGLAIVMLISLLVKAIKNNRKRKQSASSAVAAGTKPASFSMSTEDNFLREEVSFASKNVTYPAQPLKGADIEANFCESVIDLTAVTAFTDNPVIDVDCNFATVTLYVPRTVRVTRKDETAFAAFTVKGEPNEDAAETAVVRGDVNFGSLEVIYR